MVIAVDARPLQTNATNESADFIRELIIGLAKMNELHQFVLFADVNISPEIILPQNASLVILTPRPTNFISYKWWYDVKVAGALKKYKANIFICTSGICSLATSVPQVLIIRDFAFLHHPSYFSKQSRSFYRRFTYRFLEKATSIITFSELTKKEMTSTYKILNQKISIVPVAANQSFKPLNWGERELVKEEYGKGCEYFVFNGGLNPVANLLNVLKAFSIFKKWQKTNLKLVITVNENESKEQLEKLDSYKYKNEVLLAENLTNNDLAKVIGAAYAMIFPPLYEGIGATVLKAMQCEVPVITSVNSSMTEISRENALYCNPESPQEIADQMKLIFKDEQLRNRLITAGREKVKEFSWEKNLRFTSQLIDKAVSR
jgi:glycosyltransferase involved in cell wall biosynthesis